jgi:hypothetical protein
LKVNSIQTGSEGKLLLEVPTLFQVNNMSHQKNYRPILKKNTRMANELVNNIKQQFDAEIEYMDLDLDNDELKFLEQRSALESALDTYTLEGYTRLYETLKKYALDEIVMEELQPIINWSIENRPLVFFDSDFYSKFKFHKVVLEEVQKHQ